MGTTTAAVGSSGISEAEVLSVVVVVAAAVVVVVVVVVVADVDAAVVKLRHLNIFNVISFLFNIL